MDGRFATKGNVVQVKPNAGTVYDGCFVLITKVRENDFDGAVIAPRTTRMADRGVYNIHRVGLPYTMVEHVGITVWNMNS